MTKKYSSLEQTDIKMEELEILTVGTLRSAVLDGNADKGSFMAGQVSGMVQSVRTVKEVIEQMVDVKNEMAYLEEINERISKNKG